MLEKLRIIDFRNIFEADQELSAHFNVFYGKNGAGKTSLLEALYYLAHGKSFRSHLSKRIIREGAEELIITATTHAEQKNTIGLSRKLNGEKTIRLNGENLNSIAKITKLLPAQLISVDSYRLFHDGPKARRQILDWGLFHVKHEFHAVWQQFQHALKQRNAALKQRLSFSQVQLWDQELVANAEQLDNYRQTYTQAFQPILERLLDTFLPDYPLQLRYQRGWNKDHALAELLRENQQRDYQLGYTQAGPQRADLMLYTNNTPVQDHLSQGQQKLAAYAMKLAQGILLKQETGTAPLYLIDDLPSELDTEKQTIVLQLLADLEAQICITGINREDFEKHSELSEAKYFEMGKAEALS